MRVLLQGSLGLYGVEVFVNSLAYYLRQMRIDVSIDPPLGRFLIRKEIQRSSGLRSFGRPRITGKLDKSIDLIHLNYAFASLPILLRRSAKSPLLYTVHGVPQPEIEPELMFKIGYTLEKMSLKYVANRASIVVAISEYVQSLLKKNYGINAQVIRNGVDTELFRPLSSAEKRALRSHMGVPEGKKIILFVGRLYPYKDPLTLVRSMPKIISEIPSSVFTFIGNGPLRKRILSEVVKMGLKDFARLISYLPLSELIEWFQVADAYVSTSPTEMLGFSVLEAMSCGVPVVAADSGGPIEVLGNSGVFFRSKDEVDLAEKISTIIQDDDLNSRKGQAGREIVLRGFEWKYVARKYAEQYQRLIANR